MLPPATADPRLPALAQTCLKVCDHCDGPFRLDAIRRTGGPGLHFVKVGFRLPEGELVALTERALGVRWADLALGVHLREVTTPDRQRHAVAPGRTSSRRTRERAPGDCSLTVPPSEGGPMCRFINACGCFDSVAVLDAALGMSTGVAALGVVPTRVHPNGWGAVRRTAEGALATHQNHRSLAESLEHAGLDALGTDMLAVHVRYATLPDRIGPRFTHPLERLDDSGPWYFMHNGFPPTVCQSLGLSASAFNFAEYFDHLLPRGEERLDIDRTLARLRAIPPGGTSGNAVLLDPRQGCVVH